MLRTGGHFAPVLVPEEYNAAVGNFSAPTVRGASPPVDSVNLAAKLATFRDHWQPRTIGQFNGYDLMVVKAQGEFVWHKHDDTDDFFLVLRAR